MTRDGRMRDAKTLAGLLDYERFGGAAREENAGPGGRACAE